MTTTTRPWLDASIPADRRARLLLDAMTREEKVAQMVQISYSIVTPQEADEWARLGAGSFLHILGDDARRIQRLATESRLGVPVIFGIDAIHGHGIHNGATIFPTQLTLAASWDPSLAERMGRVTAREVAAEGLHWVFSPVFCLARDLRWGRVDETFGEDPLLAGIMGAATVRGYQGADIRDADSVIACAKHYIAYGESTGGRDSYDSSVTMRAIRSTFLPPFKRAIEAGCLTVMAGYEPIDGLPCSAHAPLLRRVLKEELGFDGFVVTDWQNVSSMVRRQKIAKDMTEASKIALEAGNDMIMTAPEFYEATLGLLARGEVDERLVDDAVLRILSVKFRIGLFDVPAKVKTLALRDDPTARDAAGIFGHPDHLAESLEAARKSIILLKNGTVAGSPALPIDGRKKVRTIAVIGPNADSVRAQFGDWTFFTHPVPHLDAVPTFRVTTVLDGIRSSRKRAASASSSTKAATSLTPRSIPSRARASSRRRPTSSSSASVTRSSSTARPTTEPTSPLPGRRTSSRARSVPYARGAACPSSPSSSTGSPSSSKTSPRSPTPSSSRSIPARSADARWPRYSSASEPPKADSPYPSRERRVSFPCTTTSCPAGTRDGTSIASRRLCSRSARAFPTRQSRTASRDSRQREPARGTRSSSASSSGTRGTGTRSRRSRCTRPTSSPRS